MSWLGLGISCLWLEDFRMAEEALCTANIYDSFNSDIWGYLCYLYLLDNRILQAQLAFEKTIEFNCRNNILLEQMSDKWYTLTKYQNTVLSLKQIIKYYYYIFIFYIPYLQSIYYLFIHIYSYLFIYSFSTHSKIKSGE